MAIKWFIRSILLLAASYLQAAENLHPELEKFRPYINKTYRGEFDSSTAEHPIVDISKWERHLNGNAIRITHSLNDGEYGGETIIFWDKEQEKIRFYYFTTAGFYTKGEVTFDGQIFISKEEVSGSKEGITEVKAKAWIQKDGSMRTESQYLKHGKWVEGHSAVYREIFGAEPTFK